MAGFDHKPAASAEVEDVRDIARRSRLGLVLFFIYLAFYGGFMWLCAFDPDRLQTTPIAGINVAILYGFFLIAAALLLALIYAWLCRAGKDA